MKKLLAILFLFSFFFSNAQYRSIDWKCYVLNVINLTDSTYQFDAVPIDYTDPGSITREIGNYFVDFIGQRYKIIDSDVLTITVLDNQGIVFAPTEGLLGRVYQSVGDGDAPYIGGVDITVIDDLSKWKIVAADNELLYRAAVDSVRGEWTVDKLVIDGDSLTATTQISDDDTTIVTLGYSILGKDSLRSELSDSIDLVQAENVLTKDSLRQELNDSIDLVQNEIVLAKDSLRSEVADTSLILKQYTNTSVDSVRGELADTSAFMQTLLNNKIDSFYFTNAHEADPLFSNWNKREGINIYLKQIIDGESILFAIDANTGKDTIGIYHVNRDDLNLVSGENTGDQDLSNYAELDGNQSFTGINEFPSTIKIGPGINEIGYFLSKTNDDGSVVWTSITASQVYKGTWNANTNTPTLANETGTAGWYYRCTVAGTTDFGAGGIAFVIGDDVTYNGSLWERIPASTRYVHPSYQARALKLTGANVIDSIIVDNIGSVSQITTRALSTTDVPEGTNKYYTEARVEANSAVALNTDKETNVPTQLSAGTVTGTTYGITSDGSANDIILQEANTTQAGLLGASKWNEIVANSGKDTTGIYHSNRGVLDGITATDTTWWGSHFVNTDETDQVWVADKPSYFDSTQVKALPVSTFTNDVGYITNASEADPLFSNWNRKDGINIYSKQIIDGDIVFEKELADSENNINVGFTLSSSCLVVFNGQGIPSTVWSGIGTNTLNLSLPTKLYDKIIVKK